MNINYVEPSEIEAIVHTVIEPKNIIQLDSNDENVRVIVQNMDKDIIEKSRIQLIDLLSSIVPKNYGIWVNSKT